PGRDQPGFSFSGLKTALSTYLRDHPSPTLPDLCASYQEAIVDALVRKTLQAIQREGFRDLVVAGGVAANPPLREKLKAALPAGVRLHIPPPSLCTDNGAMIAALGALRFQQGEGMRGEELFKVDVAPMTEAKRARGKQ